MSAVVPEIRMETNIILVGCGNMGQALLGGWLTRGVDRKHLRVVDREASAISSAQSLNVFASTELSGALEGFNVDLVVFAVKPQNLEALLPAYRGLADSGTIFLSVAAGKPISFYEDVLGKGVTFVRAMPNMPAAIHQGITVLCPNLNVQSGQRKLIGDLMAAIGEIAWLEKEETMDAVTAVSGSGPAYVFLLIEGLIEAGIEVGLGEKLAKQLAEATVAGASAYAMQVESGAAELREQVASPGGTTAAALEVLMGNDAFNALLKKAVRAATDRGQELG